MCTQKDVFTFFFFDNGKAYYNTFFPAVKKNIPVADMVHKFCLFQMVNGKKNKLLTGTAFFAQSAAVHCSLKQCGRKSSTDVREPAAFTGSGGGKI